MHISSAVASQPCTTRTGIDGGGSAGKLSASIDAGATAATSNVAGIGATVVVVVGTGAVEVVVDRSAVVVESASTAPATGPVWVAADASPMASKAIRSAARRRVGVVRDL